MSGRWVPPGEGVVDDGDVAFARAGRAASRTAATLARHRAEVDGDVGGLGEQVAVGVEEGAGEVAALLDVGGEGDPLERDAHLLGGGFEEVAEEFEFDGVGGHGEESVDSSR